MDQLTAPAKGVTVRMYRQGHGDCYLLAFPRKDRRRKAPYYVLIDCGYKRGSQKKPDPADLSGRRKIPALPNTDFQNIVDNIAEVTKKRIDLFIITHEHEDHVNGIKEKYFGDFHIEEAWFAWTENPKDELAKELDKGKRRTIQQLIGARHQLALAVGPENPTVLTLENFIGLELGLDEDGFNETSALAALAAVDENGRRIRGNRGSMYFVTDKANENKGTSYLLPNQVKDLDKTAGVRAFVLGPPRDAKKLRDEDPRGQEAFHLAMSSTKRRLALSDAFDLDEEATAPFENACALAQNVALGDQHTKSDFFRTYYGAKGEGTELVNEAPSEDNADWRRIDEEWLYAAEQLAIKLNSGVNNSSLVLAFELPHTKKNLLFVGDAQRGNWITWSDCEFEEVDGTKITPKELLGRTVLYKVGHHGSHNATLKGEIDSDYANLSWMGQGAYGEEFTAMINAVNAWAVNLHIPWIHPLPSIKAALQQKAQGRIFQTDTSQIDKPSNVSDTDWQQFLARATFHDLYFDYTILDE
ncbi:MAG: hypothetical protein AAGJ18_04305 [Bacteroidota bacterium]